MIAQVGPGSGRGPTVTMLQFRHMGGELAREAPGAGASATLPGEIAMLALGVVMDQASDVAVRSALDDLTAAVLPHRAGDYPNFVEEPADASTFFEPQIWTRLQAVKTLYDPADLSIGNHHIAPHGRSRRSRPAQPNAFTDGSGRRLRTTARAVHPRPPSPSLRGTAARRPLVRFRRGTAAIQRSPMPLGGGLTSMIGLRCTASKSRTRTRRPSIEMTVTRCRPTGFGLSADRR